MSAYCPGTMHLEEGDAGGQQQERYNIGHLSSHAAGSSSRLSRSSRSETLAAVLAADNGSSSSYASDHVATGSSSTAFDHFVSSPQSSSSQSHLQLNSGFQVTSRLNPYQPITSPSISPSATPSLTPNHSGSSSRRSYPPSPSPPLQMHSTASSRNVVANQNQPSTGPKTTLTLSSSIDSQGRRMVNQYVRLKTIGQGSHGKVWLCAEPSNSIREDEEEASLTASAKGKSTAQSWGTGEEEGDAEEGITYCAVKSVAREGVGRGKSLRHAKGRKAEALIGIGSDDQVKREVAIMKRLDHRNVVRLKEVIDDVKSKKVFMVLEFMAGGQIVWQDESKNPTMTVDEARRTFRDVVLGLEYLHYQGIIHRDIKPANLLWTEDHSLVKISDFGVSHVSDALDRATPGAGAGADDKALRKTAGSPAFFAPELCHPAESAPTPEGLDTVDNYFSFDDKPSARRSTPSSLCHSTRRIAADVIISPPLPSPSTSDFPHHRPTIGKGIDVWALGITLYCLLFGDTPFMARTEYELYNVIVKESITIPERMGREQAWTGVGDGWSGCGDGIEGRETINLLSRLLEKDPSKRIALDQVKTHPWVLRNLASPTSWLSDTNPTDTVTITEDDVNHATQEREALDAPRVRPSVRRALNAALQRFPTFSRKKDNIDLGLGDAHYRSKSGSSESRSIGTNDGRRSEGPSRQSSDATNPRQSLDHGEGASKYTRNLQSGGRGGGRAAVEADGSPTLTGSPQIGRTNSESRWGLKRRTNDLSTLAGVDELSRTPSSSSSFRAGLSLHHHFLPSRKTRLQTASGDSASHPSTIAPPPTRSASPFPLSDSESASAGHRLSKMLSRLGGRLKKQSIAASASDDDVLTSIPANSRQAYASKRSSLPLVGAHALEKHDDEDGDDVADRSEAAPSELEDVDSEFEYSSDEDDELTKSPVDHADGRGWHSSLARYGEQSEYDGDGLEREGLERDGGEEDAVHFAQSKSVFTLDGGSDRSAAFVSHGIDLDPSDFSSPLGRPSSAKTWRGLGGGRDGSIKNGVESTSSSSNSKKWHVYTNEGDNEDEEDEDDVDDFFSTRRKKV